MYNATTNPIKTILQSNVIVIEIMTFTCPSNPWLLTTQPLMVQLYEITD